MASRQDAKTPAPRDRRFCPGHYGCSALNARNLHRNALGCETTHGHHLLYPTWSRLCAIVADCFRPHSYTSIRRHQSQSSIVTSERTIGTFTANQSPGVSNFAWSGHWYRSGWRFASEGTCARIRWTREKSTCDTRTAGVSDACATISPQGSTTIDRP
jgi:hypothetical protein